LATFTKVLKQFWKAYSKNKAAVFGLAITAILVLLASLAQWIAPYNPYRLNPESLSPPSSKYLMGTDELGRDIFSGVLYGLQTSLFIGFLAAVVSALIGTIIGAISGFFGGTIDHALMRFTEIFMILPTIVVTLVVIALFGSRVINIIVVIGAFAWPNTARLVRAEFLSLKERDFVLAAKAMGVNNSKLIFSEILPNATAPIVVSASLQIARAIVVEAGLSFLGLGDPTTMSLGRMLGSAQLFLRTAWWMAIFPGVTIFLVALSLNMVGDGLNDALNPRFKERYR
jgi:peptide/nickel transport system permease protein